MKIEREYESVSDDATVKQTIRSRYAVEALGTMIEVWCQQLHPSIEKAQMADTHLG